MKSTKKVQDRISKYVSSFYAKTFGKGPRKISVYIIEDMVIVRTYCNLLPIEKMLIKQNNGWKMVKDIRQALHEATTSRMSSKLCKFLGKKVIRSHSDVSTKSGERIEIYILENKFEVVD